jgi:hypothetical protein
VVLAVCNFSAGLAEESAIKRSIEAVTVIHSFLVACKDGAYELKWVDLHLHLSASLSILKQILL